MQEGWAAFMGAIAGSAITAAVALKTIAYQHSKLREEHIQDILIQERVEKYKEINSLLFKLWWYLPLPQISLRKLYSAAIQKQIANTKEYINHNSLFLGPKVQYVFWEYFSELEKWCRLLKHYSEKELNSKCPNFEDKLKKTLDNLFNCTRAAMLEDLSISGFEIFSSDEVRSLYKKGIRKINNYFKKGN
jgi:hypothetical protein